MRLVVNGTRVLAVVTALAAGGCVRTKIQGRVVSCVDGTPIEGAKLTVAEASKDPAMTTTETSNYYYGASGADGAFGVMTGSSEPTAWAAKASKKGFKEGAVRYEVGELNHDICLEPEK